MLLFSVILELLRHFLPVNEVKILKILQYQRGLPPHRMVGFTLGLGDKQRLWHFNFK